MTQQVEPGALSKTGLHLYNLCGALTLHVDIGPARRESKLNVVIKVNPKWIGLAFFSEEGVTPDLSLAAQAQGKGHMRLPHEGATRKPG